MLTHQATALLRLCQVSGHPRVKTRLLTLLLDNISAERRGEQAHTLQTDTELTELTELVAEGLWIILDNCAIWLTTLAFIVVEVTLLLKTAVIPNVARAFRKVDRILLKHTMNMLVELGVQGKNVPNLLDVWYVCRGCDLWVNLNKLEVTRDVPFESLNRLDVAIARALFVLTQISWLGAKVSGLVGTRRKVALSWSYGKEGSIMQQDGLKSGITGITSYYTDRMKPKNVHEDRSKTPCKGFSKGWPLSYFKSGSRKLREPGSRKFFFAKDCDRTRKTTN